MTIRRLIFLATLAAFASVQPAATQNLFAQDNVEAKDVAIQKCIVFSPKIRRSHSSGHTLGTIQNLDVVVFKNLEGSLF